jgi:hypothetical protein
MEASMINPLFTAWHPVQAPAAAPDPLAAIEQAVECLAAGQPIPEPAASLLHEALRRVLAGARFEQAMGLQAPRSGQRTPVQIAAMERRNAMIRDLAELLPGKSGDKADAIAALLSDNGRARCGILEADMLAEELRALKRSGLELPTSARQIRRVICRK